MKTKGPQGIRYDPRLILVLDDCLYDDVWARDKYMRYLFMNGRHVRIMVFITMQHVMGIPPALRTNVDYSFIYRDMNASNHKRIYENYANSGFHNVHAFSQVFVQCTENFECMVVDNTSLSNKLCDIVYWYKATIQPPYQLCERRLWELSQQQQSEDDGGAASEMMEYEPTNLASMMGGNGGWGGRRGGAGGTPQLYVSRR
jgi:hypothetical protein